MIRLNINKLRIGESYTYKKLCEILEIKYYSGGNAKARQLKELRKQIKYEKNGTKYTILELIDNDGNNVYNYYEDDNKDNNIKEKEENLNRLKVFDVDMSLLKINMEFKSYRELCRYLNMEYPSGKNCKESQLKEIGRFVDIKFEGNRIKIIEVFETPKPKLDNRCNAMYNNLFTKKEKRNEFDGYYVYAHLKDGIVVYIGKGCKKRCSIFSERKYSQNDIDEIKILKRFDNELEAFKYEERMISYYQSIGQCKYNDDTYHAGNIRDKDIKSNIKYEKLIEKRNKLQNKINELVNELDKINDELKNYNNSN